MAVAVLLVVAAAAALCSSTSAFPSAIFNFSAGEDIVDLTYPFDGNTIYWPEVEAAGFKYNRVPEEVWRTGGHPAVMYRQGHFIAGEHGGTHIDAPLHFNRAGIDIAELTVDQLAGPVVVIDVVAKCEKNFDYQTNLKDVQIFEKRYGRIPNGSYVLMKSGWGSRFPSKELFFNSDVGNIFNVSSLHFPGWHWDAVNWLIKHRDIRGVGSDASSTDNARENDGKFRTHLALGKAGRVGLEYVANIDKLPPTGAQILVVPMKIAAGTGAPTRMFAILPASMRVSPEEFAIKTIGITTGDGARHPDMNDPFVESSLSDIPKEDEPSP